MRGFALIVFMITSLSLLTYAIGVAQDGDQIFMSENFDDKEKKETWEVLERDAGSGFTVDKGFLNAFGALRWQFRMPFTVELPPGRLAGAVQLEFRYNVARSKDDQSFIVGLGFTDGLVAERVAAVALNAANLGINEDLNGWDAKPGEWHSVRMVLDRLSDKTYEVHLNGTRVGFRIPVLARGKNVDSVFMCTKPNARGSQGRWWIDDIIVSIVPLAVEPHGKLTTTWGKLKASQ
jgi:hypothetical protein